MTDEYLGFNLSLLQQNVQTFHFKKEKTEVSNQVSSQYWGLFYYILVLVTAPSGSTVRALLHVFFMMVETTPVINDDNLSGMASPFLPFWLLAVVLISEELFTLSIRSIFERVTSRIQTVESQGRRWASFAWVWMGDFEMCKEHVVLHVWGLACTIRCFPMDFSEEFNLCLTFQKKA